MSLFLHFSGYHYYHICTWQQVHYSHKLLLITGLCNMQTIRTAEMSDIKVILFVRDKKTTDEMIELAEENEMVLIETSLSMYRTSGILFNLGIQPLY